MQPKTLYPQRDNGVKVRTRDFKIVACVLDNHREVSFKVGCCVLDDTIALVTLCYGYHNQRSLGITRNRTGNSRTLLCKNSGAQSAKKHE